MKILQFTFRGQIYKVDQQGRIKANGLSDYSNDWIFLGGSHHHFCNRITRPLSQVFKTPEILNNCLGADKDHGTYRIWGGQYYGRLPRINNTRIINEII